MQCYINVLNFWNACVLFSGTCCTRRTWGILLTLEFVAAELFYIWRNFHHALTDLNKIIFFLKLRRNIKYLNKKGIPCIRSFVHFLQIGIKKHHIGDYKTYLLMVTTFSQVAYRIDQYTWEDNSHSPMKVIWVISHC